MRGDCASRRTKIRPERQREGEPQSHGRLFKLARMACITVSLLALVLFVALLPTYVTYLHTVCTTPCAGSQLPARTAQALQAAGLSLNVYADFVLALTITSALLDVALAALLLWRASKNGMALLVGLMLVLLGTISLLGDSSLLTPLLGSVVAMILAHFFISLAMDCVLLVLFLFPNGQFVPSWMRPFVIGWIILMPILTDLLSLSSPPGIYIPLSVLDNILWVIIWLSVIGAQFYRYRHVSTPKERQQTKWVLFGFVLLLLIVFGLNLPQTIFPELNLPDSPFYFVAQFVGTFTLILFLPLFFSIAILGYRLWDIDIIIKRTLVYGTLTLSLALIYAGMVIGLGSLVRLFTGQLSESPVVIVASTLAIAALFQPLRHRLQAIIDRRFYRRKYNAAKTLEAFSATLRNEVDLDQLRQHLLAVVQQTMQPEHVSLWVRPPEHTRKQQTTWSDTPPAL
jgi:MFS family permease